MLGGGVEVGRGQLPRLRRARGGPIGNGEQRLNVSTVVAAGGGILVDDARMTADWVCDNLPSLLRDSARLAAMASAAASVGERGGDQLLADLVHRAARRVRR